MAGEWYWAVNGKKTGPFAVAQLQQLAAAGQLRPTDMVLCQGTSKWVAAGSVADLFPRGAQAQAVVAAPPIPRPAPPPAGANAVTAKPSPGPTANGQPPQEPTAVPKSAGFLQKALGVLTSLGETGKEMLGELKGMHGTIKQVLAVAAALPVFLGPINDFLTPLVSLNRNVFLVALFGVVVLIVAFRRRDQLLSGLRVSRRTLAVASLVSVILTLGFGGWWFLALVKGDGKRGFMASNVGLIGRLQSAVLGNEVVSTTENKVDLGGVFDQAISKEQARATATERLRKGLDELPKLLVAESPDKPDFDADNSSVVIPITLRADARKYATYRDGLADLLKKISVAEDSSLLTGDPYKHQGRAVPGLFGNEDHRDFMGPKVNGTKEWCIWLNVFNDELHSKTRWNAYVVDADAAACLAGLGGRTSIRCVLLDGAGQVVTEDEFDFRDEFKLAGGYDANNVADGSYRPDDRGPTLLPFLYVLRVRRRDGTTLINVAPRELWDDRAQGGGNHAQNTESLFIAPYSFTVKTGGRGTEVFYQPQLNLRRSVKVSLEQLKRIKTVRCEVRYRPPTSGGERPTKDGRK